MTFMGYELKPAMPWLCVEEQLPAINEVVIVWDTKHEEAVPATFFAWGKNRHEFVRLDNGHEMPISDIMHWMPLPLGPDAAGVA